MLSAMGQHGEGGVSRRKDGRLQVAVTMLDGHRVFRYVPKDRDKARQRRRAELLRRELVAYRERELEPWTQTLGDYLRSWIAGLPDVDERELGAATHVRGWLQAGNVHIIGCPNMKFTKLKAYIRNNSIAKTEPATEV